MPDVADIQSLEAAVGDVMSLHGRTQLRINRDGTFVVEHLESGADADQRETTEHEIDRVEGNVRELIDADPDELLRRAESLPWGQRFPNRLGIPDEAIVEFSVRTPSGETQTFKAWLRDLEEDPDLGRFIARLRDIVERSTQGRRFL